jgi:P22 coat protein - gene protein 5
MKSLYLSRPFVACFENQLDAYVPELWAQEGLAILEENMVMANLVHRDFENEVAKFGDVVNTRKPGEFKIRRKTDGTTLTQQDATAQNVPVALDQWFYSSFVIRDGEGSKSFQELSDIYLRPAMLTIARGVDRALLGRVHAYLGGPKNRIGKLGGLSPSTAKDWVLEAREKLNVNKAPMEGRRLVMAPNAETAMLKTDIFLKANERGDGGTALENATLGRILGFDTFMCQNTNCVLSGADTEEVTVTEPYAAGYAGAQLATISPENGEFCVVPGNDQPTWITAHVDATSFTLNEANKYATEDNAVAIHYKKCDVAADYAAGYSKGIVVDGYTSGKAPQVGQLIAFGTGAGRHTYTVIESEDGGATCTLYLDRPLEKAVANNDLAYPGPYGSMNLAFHRDALALVTRPLALPDTRMGVMAAVVPHNGIGMRVLMQYDINAGGTVVNCDILAGVAVLQSGLCVPVLG